VRLLPPKSRLDRCDAVIVVPPFAALEVPALGAHLLQAGAKRAGFRVEIWYASLSLAAAIGERNYTDICYAPYRYFLGERLFAAAAFGGAALGQPMCDRNDPWMRSDWKRPSPIGLGKLQSLERKAGEWVEHLVAALLQIDPRVVGCSTMYQQTGASVALLKRVKHLRPEIVTVIGGPNCEGEMAAGILSLDAGIDFVFSGESDASFPKFLQALASGKRPPGPVILGEPCLNLDHLPTPDFAQYYEQLEHFLPNSHVAPREEIWLPYESSRGCWWGQKHHCTFCGLNGHGMVFREKAPDRVIGELKQLLPKHPSAKVVMVDNIMPHDYLHSLIPRLGTEVPGLHLFYMQKANLSMADVVALKKAGVAEILPGIEALSSSLLKRMDKGVSARQNIALLRYARSTGLSLVWNLLYAFPGDLLCEYEQTLALLPLLTHLQPPGLIPLRIDRFSPYFNEPARYGLSNLRPMAGYASVFPERAELAKVAYHFDADYRSESRENPEIIRKIGDQVEAWQRLWEAGALPPTLQVTPLTGEDLMLLDTRGLPETLEIQFLTRQRAALALVGGRTGNPADVAWALDHKLIVECDATLVPLATADPEILEEFENEARRGAGPGHVQGTGALGASVGDQGPTVSRTVRRPASLVVLV
jgi:ribosomal peptide maturation radical SAM protein 1